MMGGMMHFQRAPESARELNGPPEHSGATTLALAALDALSALESSGAL